MPDDVTADQSPARPRDDKMPKWVLRSILLGFGLYVGIDIGRWLLGRTSDLLIMLLVALFISFALEPSVDALNRRGWRRGVATATVFLTVLLVMVGFMAAIGKVVVDETAQLIDNAPTYVDRLVEFANDNFGADLNADEISAELTAEDGPARGAATSLAGNAVTLSFTAVGALFRLLTIGLFAFYLVVDGPRLRRAVCSTLPPERQHRVIEAWDLAIVKTGGYLSSRGLLALVSTAFHWIAFSLIDLKYGLALAVFVGVISQFVPVIGTYLAGALPTIVALANDPIDALWVIAIVVVYQQIENYLLAPRITARTMELHPAVAFGAVIAGGAILGAPGALLALPAAAMAQAIGSSYITVHPVAEEIPRQARTPWSARRRVKDPDQ